MLSSRSNPETGSIWHICQIMSIAGLEFRALSFCPSVLSLYPKIQMQHVVQKRTASLDIGEWWVCSGTIENDLDRWPITLSSNQGSIHHLIVKTTGVAGIGVTQLRTVDWRTGVTSALVFHHSWLQWIAHTSKAMVVTTEGLDYQTHQNWRHCKHLQRAPA